jgi:alpha-beta hydrolase superfamily lysophospholipase
MSEPRPLLRTRSWRKPGARRKALLVHGLESDSATMWRFGHHLAERGWEAVSVDLVGHGLSH